MSNSSEELERINSTDENKRKRRPRNDDNNRDYICSCGKSYLSYPALYTHIKTKHDGKAPGTVQMPRTEKGNKLKKYNFKQENPDGQYDSESTLNEMIHFLNSIEQKNRNYEAIDLFQKFHHQDKVPLLEALADWQNNKVTEQITESGIYNTTIDRVFAKFISNISKKVDKQVLMEVIIILCIWRKGLNKDFSKFQKDHFTIYTRQSNTGNILELVNDLVLVHYPQKQKEYASLLSKGKMLISPRRDYNLCKFLYYFSKWLFAEKYTNSKIKFNQDD